MFYDLAPYSEYGDNQTWEGLSPIHWRQATMRAVARERTVSGVPDEPMLSVTIKHGVTTQAALLSESSKRDGSNLDRAAYKLVEPGDIAYNKMRAWQGAAGMSRFRGIVSPAYVVLRPVRTITHPLYLHYLLRLPEYAAEAARWSYGITSDQWSLRPEHFRRIPLNIPPLDEQEAIVTYLAHAHQRINQVIATKLRLIALLQEESRAIADEAMAGRHLANQRSPAGEWLGDLPSHWETTKIKWITEPLTQGWSPQADAQPAGDDEWGVVKAGCANWGRFRPEQNKRLPSDLTPRVELEIRDGDLLISRANTLALVGSVALVRNPRPKLMLCDKVFRTHVNEAKAFPQFVALAMQTRASRAQIENGATGASQTMQNIGQGVVRELVVPLPPMEEQRELVDRVHRGALRAERQIAVGQREIALLEEFRTRLTSDVVTGQLDVRAVAASLPEIDPEAVFAAPDGGASEDDEESIEGDDQGEA